MPLAKELNRQRCWDLDSHFSRSLDFMQLANPTRAVTSIKSESPRANAADRSVEPAQSSNIHLHNLEIAGTSRIGKSSGATTTRSARHGSFHQIMVCAICNYASEDRLRSHASRKPHHCKQMNSVGIHLHTTPLGVVPSTIQHTWPQGISWERPLLDFSVHGTTSAANQSMAHGIGDIHDLLLTVVHFVQR